MLYRSFFLSVLTALVAVALFPSALSLEQSAVSVRDGFARRLGNVDFDSICYDLRTIFNNKCNCGNRDQVESGNSIDCDNGGLTAHAEFESLTVKSMQICEKEFDGKVCTTLYYANTIAVHCVLSYNDLECGSCFVCDASSGLLGVRVDCDAVQPSISTNGECETVSSYLHLQSAAHFKSVALCVVVSLSVLGWLF